MQIIVNGKPFEAAATLTLLELLRLKGLKPERVVVELNGEIVDKPRYGEVTLKENDTLEILGFVGGG
jgi:thiamine biosynthesis protein ThiS